MPQGSVEFGEKSAVPLYVNRDQTSVLRAGLRFVHKEKHHGITLLQRHHGRS